MEVMDVGGTWSILLIAYISREDLIYWEMELER